jgi:peptide/nickel transport system substrate-binding protein
VTVFGNDEPELRSIAEYYSDVLNEIGLKSKPRIVEASVYFTTIGNQKTKAQTGFTNWFQDFPHPANFMFLVDGRTIQPTNNPNFGDVQDPFIDKTLTELEKEPDIERAAPKYAAIDRRLVQQAHVVPYGNRKLTVFMSDRMNFGAECNLVHPVFNSDFTSFCLK